MNSHSGFRNRRSGSQFLPRLFLLLQIVIMALVSYISFTILTAIGMPMGVVGGVLFISNCYFLNKVFFKCRSISKRNRYTQGFQTR